MLNKYFLDPPEGYFVPPVANDLRWYWLPANSSAFALTTFDEDDHPCDIGFDLSTRHSYDIIRWLVLHEMTHMRIGYKWSCGQVSHRWRGTRVPKDTIWYQETVRLANAGALVL
jgi:hypothetical protein